MSPSLSKTEELCRSWWDRPLPDLVDHIVNDFHRPLGQELPELLGLAEQVWSENRESAQAAELEDVYEVVRAIWSEVENHIDAEEGIVFPWILTHKEGAEGFEEPYSSIRHDHNFVYRALSRLKELTKGFRTLPGEDPRGPEVVKRCKKVDRDLRYHQRLEEEVLFPRARGETP